MFKLRQYISNRIGDRFRDYAIKRTGKGKIKDLPYTMEELVKHIEKLFQEGMSWLNYGQWHVDHIVPHSKFNYTSTKDKSFLKCWSLGNLQPLWAEDNLRKSNK